MSSEESLERTQAVAPPSLTRAKRLLHRSYAKLPDFTPLEYRDWDDKQLRQQVLARLRQLVEEHAAQLGKVDTDSLLSALLNELTRMGPLQQLMKEEGVTEVMINPNSGFPQFDRLVMGAVARAAPFAPIPRGLGKRLTIVAPFEFHNPMVR